MSLVKQVGLVPAGCQPWNNYVCAASGDRFAYCATLAIYIYQFDAKYNEFRLHSIMSEHKKTITAIAWNPKNPDVIASAGCDNVVMVWNIAEQHVVARLENTRGTPMSIGWCPHEEKSIAFVYGRGPLFQWNHATAGAGLSTHKDAQNFNSFVCQFQWHPKKMGKIVFGHKDGSISLFSPGQRNQKHVLRPEDLDSSDDEDPVTSLEWDPLSTEYLLMTNTHHGIRLIDSENLTIIMKFSLPSAAAQVKSLSWIHSAPGMFVTGDTHSGVLRLWNVSKSSPIENIRVKKTGFHALHVLSTTQNNKVTSLAEPTSPTNSTSSHSSPAVMPQTRYALPPAHALCTFTDGGVGLYDIGRRKWDFLRDQGHIETIFDCKFHPDDPNLLATGSFDGTIKVWNINTLSTVKSSPGNEGVIYSLSWAPADLNCIAASTSRLGAFIWDIGKGKVIKRFTEHGKGAVYSVAWNYKDSRRIATCGADGYCIIRQVDGQLIIKYRHPASVFGCDWSPNNKDMLATGCDDKNVRVFYIATNQDQPLKVFSGHTAKVFHVKWSPLRDGILCSGSDDATIRIWDYTQDACITVLTGHTAPVRGLLWSTEIPYLLISGSWDYSIRIWDTRDGACLDTVLDHGADVYGLTSHQDRPFVLASCSRDSTLRIWSLTPLVQPLEINIMAGRPWSEVLASPEHAMVQGTPPLLAGKASKDLKLQVDALQTSMRSHVLRWFSQFFSSPIGSGNLWELLTVIMGQEESRLSPNYSKGIMHTKHLTKYKAATAQELEMVKMSKFGGGIGAPSREDRLRDAAKLHIRLGNVQRYCELLVDLGEWEKALAVAPAVSMKYWKTLTERYTKTLAEEDSDDVIPYCVATGNAEGLVQFFISRGQLQDAFIAATAAQEGNIALPAGLGMKAAVNGTSDSNDSSMELLRRTSEQLADWYFCNGSPVLAACCHLAVDDCVSAMQKLIRGHELELAVSIGNVLSTVSDLTQLATELLSRRCEQLGRWELAVDLLKTSPGKSELAMAKLCARCAASTAEINDLHEKAGLPSMEECLEQAEKLKSGQDIAEAVKFYMLSSAPDVGLELGLAEVKERMTHSGWVVEDIWELLQMMGCMHTEKLQQHKCAKSRHELLLLCAYAGALVAIRRQYNTIVIPLFHHTIWLMKRESSDVPLSETLVSTEMKAWKVHHEAQTESAPRSPVRRETTIPAELSAIYVDLLRKAGEEKSAIGEGEDLVSGSQLPSHSDVHHSFLTGQRIQGPSFFLEDGKAAISISDALMWAKVNPFSPLGSGVRINPF